MPKSKKNRVIHLTKTVKKGKDLKTKLIEQLKECIETYENVYVFSTENMRNIKFKEVRAHWSSSRFFMGKNKVMQLALGHTPESEHRPGLFRVAQQVKGKRGLFFTNSGEEEVLKYFSEFQEPHFARSGFKATEDYVMQPGPLPPMPVSMEPLLRKLGLPVRLQEGKIVLLSQCVVCKKGDVLTPEQCKLLELFEYPMAVFRIRIHCVWSKDGFKMLREDDEDEAEEEEDEAVDGGDGSGPVELKLDLNSFSADPSMLMPVEADEEEEEKAEKPLRRSGRTQGKASAPYAKPAAKAKAAAPKKTGGRKKQPAQDLDMAEDDPFQ